MRATRLTWVCIAVINSASLLRGQIPAAGGASLPPSAVYSRLPLTFEANQGQSSPQVNFVSRGAGYTAALTAGGLVLGLRNSSVSGEPSSTQPGPTLQFNLVGAATNASAIGEDLQPGVVNYFMGNDPAQWHTRIPTYNRARYQDVYPGIDLVYYGNNRQLEYDFAIHPGADPTRIEFEILGADQIGTDSEGNLVLTIGSRQIQFLSPVIYQESNGARTPVGGAYFLKDSTHLAFRLGHYDANSALVIDPVLVYSTYLGGSGDDQPNSIGVDGSGNVYVAGYTDSANFPLTTLGSLSQNTDHVFVAKIDPTGSHLIYADYIGGNGADYGVALALDSANEVFVTGTTQSSNFPVQNAFQAQQPGPYTGFLSKLSADGSSLLYSTYLGGNAFDEPTSLAVDSLDQAHVAGLTASQNFPTANAYQSAAQPNQAGYYGNYGFLTKFSANGSSLVYSTYFAGNTNVALNCGSPCWPSPYTGINAIALDANDNAYVTGATNTYNFPTTSGAYLTADTLQNNEDAAFVGKFTSAGALNYSSYFYANSLSPVTPNAIAVDSEGSAYITGVAASDGTFPITSTSICDPGVYHTACGFAFVTKFDPAAATLAYSTFLGPNNAASPFSLVLDSNNDAFVLAGTSSSTFTTNSAIELYSSGSDLLLVEVDPVASTQLMSTYIGGSGDEQPAGIALDAAGNIYVAGSTSSTDLPVTGAAFQTISGGGTDAFIAKIGPTSAPSVSLTPLSLQFGTVSLGGSSAAQTVLLRNMGSSALSLSISPTGDFGQTNDCSSSVPAAGSCSLSVTFTPTAAGNRSGSILLEDNAAGSPQQISLSGVGLGPGVLFSPTALTFASVPLGTSAAAQTVTLTNNGNAALQIASVQAGGDFSQTNNCPSTLAVAANCSINVAFTPTASGTRTGTLTVNDNLPGNSQTVSLSGTGADFSVTASPSQNTVNQGSSATYTIHISSVGGAFNNPVSLSCSGLPTSATCSFSPASPTPSANGVSSTLTIGTGSSGSENVLPFSSPTRPVMAMWLQFQTLGLVGMVVLGSRKKSRKSAVLVLLVVLVFGLLLLTGCAGGTGIGPQNNSGGSGTTYNVTVTGVSGTLQHSVVVSLTVK